MLRVSLRRFSKTKATGGCEALAYQVAVQQQLSDKPEENTNASVNLIRERPNLQTNYPQVHGEISRKLHCTACFARVLAISWP